MEECCIAIIGRKDLCKGPLLNLTNGGEVNSGKIAWNKGIPRPQSVKDLISKNSSGKTPWNKGKKSKRNSPSWNSGRKMLEEEKTVHEKPIHTPDGIFKSLTAASKFYNRTIATIWGRFKLHPTEYYYITKEEYANENNG